MRVLGMGNALVDVLAPITDDCLLDKLGLPKGSMQLIDKQQLDLLNKSLEHIDKHLATGGSASNTIAGLAKLGIETGFLGKIGKDFYGDFYKTDLESYGVISHLTEVSEASGVATALISTDGERTFGTYLGAAADLTPEDLSAKDFEGYHFFYIEGYLVQNLELIRKAVVLAKEAGLKVVLDLANYFVVEGSRDFLLEIIPEYVDILFANEDEAKSLLGLEPEAALAALAKSVEIVIVKVGADGSWIQQGNQKVFVPALIVDCIDTTGAGDIYAAGFLFGYINGYSLSLSGKIGTLLAGNVIQVFGPKLDNDKWVEIKKEIAETIK